MNIKKLISNNKIYDIITQEEYFKNHEIYKNKNNIVIEYPLDNNEMQYYLLSSQTSLTGAIPFATGMEYRGNPIDGDIINFSDSKSIDDLIKSSDILRTAEKGIQMFDGNSEINQYSISDIDEPEARGLKEAVNSKKIHIRNYESRWSDNNFMNDIRNLNKSKISISKLKTIAENLDIEVEMIFKDKDDNIPNPIGKVIKINLTGEGNDEL